MINLPEVIQEMLSYKESLGFSRKTYENYLSDFNKYFSHGGYNKFTAETVLSWCERRDTETPECFPQSHPTPGTIKIYVCNGVYRLYCTYKHFSNYSQDHAIYFYR